MSRVLPWAVLAAVGCSSGGGNAGSGRPVPEPGAERTETISYLETGSVTLEYRVEDNVVVHSVPAPPRDVLAALEHAFIAVGLPVPVVDPGTMNGYISGHRVSRRMGERRLSRFFHCGDGATGPVANVSRIEIALTVEVRTGENGGSYVRTTVKAIASPFDPTTRPRSCTSTRELEIALVETVATVTQGMGNAPARLKEEVPAS